MTKKDIVRRIADELGRQQIETMQIVQKTLTRSSTSWPRKAASNCGTSASSR